MAETRKAFQRRVTDGFFFKYIKGKGIDIGCGISDTMDGIDLIHESAMPHDKHICNAETMEVFKDEEFDYVYSSHVLEHLNYPLDAIRNWFRILKKGGYLIISVPHRDAYEKKDLLPSNWNQDHRYFLLPYDTIPPCTFSFHDMINNALKPKNKFDKPNYEIVEFKEQLTGFTIKDPNLHSDGEISIECIIKKI